MSLKTSTEKDILKFLPNVCYRPEVNEGDLHPEEGSISEITQADWEDMLNPLGQLEDDLPLRKVIHSYYSLLQCKWFLIRTTLFLGLLMFSPSLFIWQDRTVIC